jgi:branched-chain amino acid transport system ATP-binding protein
MTMLKVADLVVYRGAQRVVDNVSFEINPGEILALLGPNGAGKSTLVSALSGALPISEGTVEVDGVDLKNKQPHAIRRAGLAAVPEGHVVLSSLSVRDNLLAAASMMTAREADQAVEELLEIFPELKEKIGALGGFLSGGQQQMLSLAQALIIKPKFILADEMSFGLAPVIVNRLIPLVKRAADSGVGVLLIEQYTHLALAVADRIAVLERGRIIAEDNADAFREDPDSIGDLYLKSDQQGTRIHI